MELHELKPAEGATKKGKRIARGQGSGHGGTATRGHKGQKSRSGYSRKRAFEGGQMPLQIRLPKRGFKSPNRVEYAELNLAAIEAIATKYKINDISLEWLRANRMIKKSELVKVLGRGELNSKVTVEANAVSVSAKEAIESKGGSINIV